MKNGIVAFTEVQDKTEQQYLEAQLPAGLKPVFFEAVAQEVRKEIAQADILSVFIKSKVDRNMIEGMPNLKMITTRSTGFDHIDIAGAREKKIPVTNVPTYGENTVAEHAFALLLSLSRNLRKAYLRAVQNNFSLDGLMGFDLKGKILGVVGTGNIGLHVIRIGVSFGMKVIAFDVREQKILAEALNFEYASLEDLLKRSDIITLHCPYLPSTHHLINEKTIRLIKKGAILINTARGGLVETNALMTALDEGILAGAGLDVIEEEEGILEEKMLLTHLQSQEHWAKIQTALKNQMILHRDNVIFTPHMAFYSREAVRKILDTTLENIRRFANHEPFPSL